MSSKNDSFLINHFGTKIEFRKKENNLTIDPFVRHECENMDEGS